MSLASIIRCSFMFSLNTEGVFDTFALWCYIVLYTSRRKKSALARPTQKATFAPELLLPIQ